MDIFSRSVAPVVSFRILCRTSTDACSLVRRPFRRSASATPGAAVAAFTEAAMDDAAEEATTTIERRLVLELLDRLATEDALAEMVWFAVLEGAELLLEEAVLERVDSSCSTMSPASSSEDVLPIVQKASRRVREMGPERDRSHARRSQHRKVEMK